MKETIIMAPGAAEAELLRTLAKNGVNTLGMRIMNPAELADAALMRSGVSVSEDFLTKKEEPALIYSFLRTIPYFGAASFADAENLAAALTVMRKLIPADETASLKSALDKGEFTEKNDAIFQVYSKYIEKCEDLGKIDAIGVIRKALSEAGVIENADFCTLKEFPISPLEKALIDKVSDGSAVETGLVMLFGKTEAELKDISFTEAYGAVNEAEHIISDIFKKCLPLDKCMVACASPGDYSQIFLDISARYGIPMTYGSGISIINSNPAKLLKLIHEWETSGYYGIDALRKILFSEAFDRQKLAEAMGLAGDMKASEIETLAQTAGSLRISFDAVENEKRLKSYRAVLDKKLGNARAANKEKKIHELEKNVEALDFAESFAKVLAEKGITGTLSGFVRIRERHGTTPGIPNGIDRSALNIITGTIDAYSRYMPGGDIDELIQPLLNRTVCTQSSSSGALHITTISGALSSMRENLYVCGLNSLAFPGSPTENYLLLDSDLTEMAAPELAPTSENLVNRKKQTFRDLLDFASALGTAISLSYPGYSLSELKDQNPSSVLFEVFEKLNPGGSMDDFRNALEHAGYFESGISADRLVGDEYSRGAGFDPISKAAEPGAADDALDRAWSPSALDIFMQCPRRFYLGRVLRIPEEEPDDPFEILDSRAFGTLAHDMMETLADAPMSREDFLKKAGEAFDDALAGRPPIHHSDVRKSEFLRMMGLTFDTDPGNEVLSAETEYHYDHPSGVKLRGYPDRVEKDAGGNYLIADFKTKRNTEHVENDFTTCLQVVVYAWLCEQAGIDISRCEYRYLRLGKTISCIYDDGMKAELAAFLDEFKRALENNDFPKNEGKKKENCKYCKFGDVCVWPSDLAEETTGEEAGEDE